VKPHRVSAIRRCSNPWWHYPNLFAQLLFQEERADYDAAANSLDGNAFG
jgi:hypothetical protein